MITGSTFWAMLTFLASVLCWSTVFLREICFPTHCFCAAFTLLKLLPSLLLNVESGWALKDQFPQCLRVFQEESVTPTVFCLGFNLRTYVLWLLFFLPVALLLPDSMGTTVSTLNAESMPCSPPPGLENAVKLLFGTSWSLYFNRYSSYLLHGLYKGSFPLPVSQCLRLGLKMESSSQLAPYLLGLYTLNTNS